jgi:hypothetical protein
MNTGKDEKVYFLDLTFAPSLRLVSIVRRFAGAFYGEMLDDPDVVARLEIATHEILENAVKAWTDGLTRIRIDLLPDGGGKLQLRTWNRANPRDLEILKERMAEIEAAADPFAYYKALMVRSATRKEGSGLGLGRVLAEAEMTVRHEIEEGQVCVIAEAPVSLPAERRR